MTCRGSRFNPELTTPGQNSPEWEVQNIKSNRNFIRKWGHFCKHDKFMKPIVPSKYNIAFQVTNCNMSILEALEPWCDRIYIDDSMQEFIDHYIDMEQPNTKFDLTKRVFCIGYNDPGSENDIVVSIDGKTFTQTDFQCIQQLTEILDSSELLTEFNEPGEEYQLGNLKTTIYSIQTYEKELILCQKKQ